MAATDRYVRSGGGSYSAAGTWEVTPGGGETTTVPGATNDVFLVAGSGQLTIDASSNVKNFNCTGYTGTITHGNFQLKVSGNCTFVAGMTYITGSLSLITIDVTSTLTTGGKLMPIINWYAGNLTLGDNVTFSDLKTNYITLTSAGTFNLNGKTLSGYSATSRILIQSSILGTPRTITMPGTFANCDFKDIQFANGGASLDLSAITGLSGDCGGNAMSGGGALTLTSPLPTTWTNTNGGYWSLNTNWSEGRVPLPQDNVSGACAFGASKTVTSDMPRLGKDIDWTGATYTTALTWQSTVSTTQHGSLTLITDLSVAGSINRFLEGRGTHTITSLGVAVTGHIVINSAGGTYTLLDAMTTSVAVDAFSGTFIDNGFSITTLVATSTGTLTRAIVKTGNWNITCILAATAWNFTSTGLTWSDTAGSITLSDTGNNAKTFAGGGLSYNNLIIAGGGSGAVSITGANTFRDFSVGYPKQIIFQHGVQQTFVNMPVFAGIDNPTKIINGSTLNGNMENWISDTNAANWIENIAGTSTMNKETSIVNSGSFALRIDVDASNSDAYALQSIIAASKRYKSEMWLKCNIGSPSFSVGGAASGAYSIFNVNTAWTKYTGFFTPTTPYFIMERNSAASISIYIDDVTLEESTAIELSSDLAGSPATLSCPGKFNYLNWCSVKDIAGKSGEMWVAVNSTNVSGNTGILFDPVSFPLSFFHVGMDGGFGG